MKLKKGICIFFMHLFVSHDNGHKPYYDPDIFRHVGNDTFSDYNTFSGRADAPNRNSVGDYVPIAEASTQSALEGI
jgi:hypothetical protein